MASKKLTDTNISDTYRGVLHARGQALRTDGITEALYDGVGTKTALSVGINSIQVKGDATFKDASNTGVFLNANEGSIELVDVESKDPYIDFKGNSSVDFDCRIVKTPNNGLEVWTGGYSNRKIAGAFQSDQNFRVYGSILLGRDSGDGLPDVGVDAYRIGTQDSLRLYSNDYIHFETQDGAGGRQVTATINRTGLSIGRGYSRGWQTLDVNGSLRLQIPGYDVPGRILTLVGADGHCEWKDPDRQGVLHFLSAYSLFRTPTNSNPTAGQVDKLKSQFRAVNGDNLRNGDYVMARCNYHNWYSWGNGSGYRNLDYIFMYRISGTNYNNQTWNLVERWNSAS